MYLVPDAQIGPLSSNQPCSLLAICWLSSCYILAIQSSAFVVITASDELTWQCVKQNDNKHVRFMDVLIHALSSRAAALNRDGSFLKTHPVSPV